MAFGFFEPDEERLVVQRQLPHWSQPGTLCFITWRTWDSLPKQVLESLNADRAAWLGRNGIEPASSDWKIRFAKLPLSVRHDYRNKISARWQTHLDGCHGVCVLRRAELAKIVADSLQHFDGERYLLTDFVIMPNHVHLLAAFPDADRLLKQCRSWKHYTAARINRTLGVRGRFWQVDDFDHLVRSPEQFDYLRKYIGDNPRRANLRPEEFIHYARD
jgi:type I restriction enzyme R subunit